MSGLPGASDHITQDYASSQNQIRRAAWIPHFDTVALVGATHAFSWSAHQVRLPCPRRRGGASAVDGDRVRARRARRARPRACLERGIRVTVAELERYLSAGWPMTRRPSAWWPGPRRGLPRAEPSLAFEAVRLGVRRGCSCRHEQRTALRQRSSPWCRLRARQLPFSSTTLADLVRRRDGSSTSALEPRRARTLQGEHAAQRCTNQGGRHEAEDDGVNDEEVAIITKLRKLRAAETTPYELPARSSSTAKGAVPVRRAAKGCSTMKTLTEHPHGDDRRPVLRRCGRAG